MIEKENSKEFARDYRITANFLRKVWFHPLLTGATVAHRAAFPEMFRDFCSKWEINIDEVVAGPLGSSIWIVSEESNHKSDFDFAIFFKNTEDHKKWQELYWLRLNDNRTPLAHPVAGGCIDNPRPLGQMYTIAPILFIPDELLVGNLEIAHNLRLFFADEYKNGNRPTTNRTFIEQEFYQIRYWPETSNPQRFEKYLEKHAQDFAKLHGREVSLVKRYKSTFIKTLNNFRPPSDETFVNAIRFNGGRLSLE